VDEANCCSLALRHFLPCVFAGAKTSEGALLREALTALGSFGLCFEPGSRRLLDLDPLPLLMMLAEHPTPAVALSGMLCTAFLSPLPLVADGPLSPLVLPGCLLQPCALCAV
jgi:hypothetical protein